MDCRFPTSTILIIVIQIVVYVLVVLAVRGGRVGRLWRTCRSKLGIGNGARVLHWAATGRVLVILLNGLSFELLLVC